MLFGLTGVFFRDLAEVVQRLCVPRSVEELIEDLFEVSLVGKGPIRILLVAENHVFQDGIRDTQEQRDKLVHLRAIVRNTHWLSMLVCALQDLLHLLELLLSPAIHELI